MQCLHRRPTWPFSATRLLALSGLLCSFQLVASFVAPLKAEAKVRMVTTLPDLAHIAHEIAGDEVEATPLLKGSEDPHFAEAVPSYIQRVSRADVVCVMGFDLEIGWMPKVLAKSANSKVQKGEKGYCEAGRTVKALDVPQGPVDRSAGDVHASGNPHFNLSPIGLIEASESILKALSDAAPEKAEAFKKGQQSFVQKMTDLHKRLQARIKASGKTPVAIEYHKQYVYFFQAYGIRSIGSIEEKPGAQVSAGRRAQIALEAKKAKVTVAFAADSTPERELTKFTELSGIPVRRLPAAAKPEPKGFAALEELQTTLVDALLTDPSQR